MSEREQRDRLIEIRNNFDVWISFLKRLSEEPIEPRINKRIHNFQTHCGPSSSIPVKGKTIESKVPAAILIITDLAKNLRLSSFRHITVPRFWDGPTEGTASRHNPIESANPGALPLEFRTSKAHETLRPYLGFVQSRISRAAQVKDRAMLRDLYPMVARAHRTSGNWVDAADAFGKAASLCLEEEDGISAARNYLDHGTALYRIREFEMAESVLREGAKILEEVHPRHADFRTESKLWDYLGLTLCRIDRCKEALDWFERGTRMRWELNYKSPLETASHLSRKAVALLALGRGREAIKLLRIAMKIRIEKGARRLLARSLKYVALHHSQEGRHLRALVLWWICRAEQESAEDDVEVGWLNFYIAGAFEELKHRESEPWEENFNILDAINKMTRSDKSAAFVLYNSFQTHLPAIRLRNAGDEAIEHYRKSLELARRLEIPDLKEKAEAALT